MISIELTGATMSQVLDQLREVYAEMIGDDVGAPPEMNLTDLIEHTKKQAAIAGWHIDVVAPIQSPDEVVSISEDTEPAEIDVKELKKETIARLKKLLFDKDGPAIVEAIKKRFNCKAFSDQPEERFVEIAAALDEATNV